MWLSPLFGYLVAFVLVWIRVANQEKNEEVWGQREQT